MTTESMANKRPDLLHGRGADNPLSNMRVSGAAREERLKTLYARWSQFEGEYGVASARNDQEVMTNLRGLMLLIMREIKRLGGDTPRFPAASDAHLADL